MGRRYGRFGQWRGGLPVERGSFPATLEWRPVRDTTDNLELFWGWISDIQAVLALAGISLATSQTAGGRRFFEAAGRRVAEIIPRMGAFEGRVYFRPVGGPGPGIRGKVAAEELRRSSQWLGLQGYGADRSHPVVEAKEATGTPSSGTVRWTAGSRAPAIRKDTGTATPAEKATPAPAASGATAGTAITPDQREEFCLADGGDPGACWMKRWWAMNVTPAMMREHKLEQQAWMAENGLLPEQGYTEEWLASHGYLGYGATSMSRSGRTYSFSPLPIPDAAQETPASDESNPNPPYQEKIRPEGLVLLGVGILGGMVTALMRKSLGTTGMIVAGATSAAAAVGGTALTLKKKRVPINPTSQPGASMIVERNLITNGKGFACVRGVIPKVVTEATIDGGVMAFHRAWPYFTDQEPPQSVGTQSDNFARMINPLFTGAYDFPQWRETIYGVDAADMGELQKVGVAKLGDHVASGGNWCKLRTITVDINHFSPGMFESGEAHSDHKIVLWDDAGAVICQIVVRTVDAQKGGTTIPWLESNTIALYPVECYITPGEYGKIPDLIMCDGMTNAFLKGTFNTEDPTALTGGAPDNEAIPMASVQTLYRLLRTYSPQTVSMVGSPLAWALLTWRAGQPHEVRSAWGGIVKTVLKIFNIATSVATVCYPALSAISPGATKWISGLGDKFGATIDKVQDAVREYKGYFQDITKDYGEIFHNWRGQMGSIGMNVPSSYLNLLPTEQFTKLIDIEFDGTLQGIATNWFAKWDSIGGNWETPNIPFTLSSVRQLIEPVERKLQTFVPDVPTSMADLVDMASDYVPEEFMTYLDDAGNIVDQAGNIIATYTDVDTGFLRDVAGNIYNEAGQVIGQVEDVVP